MHSIGVILLLVLVWEASTQSTIRCLPSRPDCCDRHRFCVFWSQRNECNLNPRWMGRNCQMACNTCPAVSSGIPSNDQPTATVSTVPSGTRDPNAPDGCNSVMAVHVETRRVFGAKELNARFNQIRCAEPQQGADCSTNSCFNQKYRTLDGTCNNVANSVLGAAFTPFSRLLSSAYDDGVNAVVSSTRRNRPNPAQITEFLLASPRALTGNASSLLVAFAQFISHDLTKNALINTCTSCNNGSPDCIGVLKGGRCQTITRSLPVCGTGRAGRAREQLNMNTAFIDGSMIYGSEAVTDRSLRNGAFLRTQSHAGRLFPPTDMRQTITAGDDRGNLFVGLASLHTTFLILHNQVASNLQNLNPRWNSDRIFQESRKIVGAILQKITYDDFLPGFLGSFHSRLVPTYSGYKSNVNPSIINEFAGAAYRLHGMIQENYLLANENFQNIGNFATRSGIGHLQLLQSVDSLYRGMMMTPARMPQRISQVMLGNNPFAADLASINIQRGRDHGFRPYNDYRKLCNLRTITDFNEWPEVRDSKVTERLAQLYSSPEVLDLYVGGLVEEPPSGSFVGPTFACIVAEQFVRLRDGDRLYYENPGVFTSAQLASIRRTSLAWVLCETSTGMRSVPENVFKTATSRDAVSCRNIQGIDLSAWRE